VHDPLTYSFPYASRQLLWEANPFQVASKSLICLAGARARTWDPLISQQLSVKITNSDLDGFETARPKPMNVWRYANGC
jgi:hypothetical protein